MSICHCTPAGFNPAPTITQPHMSFIFHPHTHPCSLPFHPSSPLHALLQGLQMPTLPQSHYVMFTLIPALTCNLTCFIARAPQVPGPSPPSLVATTLTFTLIPALTCAGASDAGSTLKDIGSKAQGALQDVGDKAKQAVSNVSLPTSGDAQSAIKSAGGGFMGNDDMWGMNRQ